MNDHQFANGIDIRDLHDLQYFFTAIIFFQVEHVILAYNWA